MGTITLKNVRATSDLTVKVRLKDGGTAISWSSLSNIKAWLYSDAQKAISGRFEVSVDEGDATILVCHYSAQKPQYLGINRVIVQATYLEDLKTYDKPAFIFVRWTDDQTQDITIDDPDVDVEIEVQDVSSSILDAAIAAAVTAAVRAEEAAAAAEHMVDIHQGPPGEDGKSPYIGENGHWYEWDEDAGEYVDTETEAQGETGTTPDITIGTVTTAEPGTPASATMTGTPEAPVLNLTIPKGVAGDTPNFTVGEVTTGQPGTPVVVTITGTPEAPVLNVQIPQGLQGNPGSSVDYPFELVNNATTNDATKAATAAVAKGLKDDITQLEQEVHNLSGKYYGVFPSDADLPDDITQPGYAFVGASEPFAIYNFDGEEWEDTGATANSIQGEPGVGFESAETPLVPDGTFIITLSNGDTMTIDLNHNHPNYFDKLVGSTIPAGGLVPDTAYKLGTLTGAVTITLASAVAGCLNHYFFTFDTSSTAPTITFPVSVTKWDGNCVTSNAPVISASKHYEVSILDGVGFIYES